MVTVIAHRGASAAAPENTIEAFHLARDLGSDWVELDARRTRDNQLVVHHDAHLSDGRPIVSTDRSDLPKLVCRLDEALEACAPMTVNIEIKNFPGEPDFDSAEMVAEQVAAMVQRRQMVDQVIISSFHYPTLARIRQIDPTIPTAFLHMVIERDWDDLAAQVASDGHRAVHPWDGVVDRSLVEAAHGHGLAVNVWTVDDPQRMAELVDLGVDGICTNVVDVARRVIDAGTAAN